MKKRFLAMAMLLLLSGCALFQNERERCGSVLDTAAEDLDAMKWRGFAGAVSHGKATALLVHGRVQQALEHFPSCIEAGKRAQFYVAESREGR
jgi:hypothetical protein